MLQQQISTIKSAWFSSAWVSQLCDLRQPSQSFITKLHHVQVGANENKQVCCEKYRFVFYHQFIIIKKESKTGERKQQVSLVLSCFALKQQKSWSLLKINMLKKMTFPSSLLQGFKVCKQNIIGKILEGKPEFGFAWLHFKDPWSKITKPHHSHQEKRLLKADLSSPKRWPLIWYKYSTPFPFFSSN